MRTILTKHEKCRKSARRLLLDTSGSTATLFALALLPSIAALGSAVDYARSASMRTSLSRAADAAALAAVKHRTSSDTERKRIATQIFKANLGDRANEVTGLLVNVTDIDSGIRVEVTAKVKNSFIAMVGMPTTSLKTVAEAAVNSGSTEIAMVLDNTGSMRNDMSALRTAANGFVDIVMGQSDGSVKVAIVPYNAAVNPGVNALPMSLMDTAGASKWHAEALESQHAGASYRCEVRDREREEEESKRRAAEEASRPKPTPVSDPGPSQDNDKDKDKDKDKDEDRGPSRPSGPGKSGGKDKETYQRDPSRLLRQFAGVLRELAGVTPAHAQVTPQTTAPVPGMWYELPVTKAPTPKAFVPNGYKVENECTLLSPAKISHFDLFNRIPGARWKGCVEARPEPYDVTDDVPSAFRPDTMFVPYFWPDEPDIDGADFKYNNSYMDDGAYDQDGRSVSKKKHPLPGWDNPDSKDNTHYWNDDDRMHNLLKYDNRTPAKIKENGPTTDGPNAACPDEILPLTTDIKTVKAKIGDMRHWFGGGTVTSEGVAWGWRTLSPEAPFTEGLPYDPNNKKFIVLMTDGLNGLAENAPDWNSMTWSDYSAYGYMSSERNEINNFDDMSKYLNARQDLVCTNAKAKGIVVFSILFRENSASAIDATRKCATDGKFFYQAVNKSELERAFTDIGGLISKLRLTK